jgi:gliding motility-associated-like protein
MEKKQLRYSIIFFIILSIFSKISFSINQTNIWYFGNHAGLDFNSGSPVALTNGQIQTDEGCSSISDESGNLLFYTDGRTVWNKTHWSMPNGYGLMGGTSSTQSAIIIKKPGAAKIYYIFTANQAYNSQGIRYSEVNMQLDGGKGDVTIKNMLLQTPSTEKLTAVRHCNGVDIWIITHDWGTDVFRSFLVSSAGISPTSVTSSVGLVSSGNENNKIGYLKASPDGNKLASAIWGSEVNRFELFDFDKRTGVVSNAILFPCIPAGSGAYGVEFSPDGSKLYGAVLSPARIYQFNLCAGSNSAIANSGVLIGTSTAILAGALQIGPDNKIYMAKYASNSLGVINNPNEAGVACNYVDCGVSLGNRESSIGLPNFMSGYSTTSTATFFTFINCNRVLFTAPENSPSTCSGMNNPVTGVSWNFNDPASGLDNYSNSLNPTHLFPHAGTYHITMVMSYSCGIDTVKQDISILQNANFATLTNIDSNICLGQSVVLTSVGGEAYSWNTGENTSSIIVSPSVTYTYSVIVSNTVGCKDTLKQKIFVHEKPNVGIMGRDTICQGNPVVLKAYGGKSYKWNTGDTDAEIRIEPEKTALYSVMISNGFCSEAASLNVVVKETPEVNVSSPNSAETYTEFNASGGESYQWYPSEGLSCSTCPDPIASPAETTTYCLAVTGRNGCVDSSYVTATISVIYIPNAFSPDDNNINDVFKPKLKEVRNYQFLIFNRWGDKVFQTSNPDEGWNGYYKGNLCEQSSYVYKINFIDNERQAFHEYTGNVTLLR